MNIEDILYKEIKDWLYHKADDKPLTLGDEKVYLLIDKLKEQLTIPVVSRSNAIDYAEGFELAMDFIDKHPADPDITDEQVKAWIKLQDFVKYHL